MTVNSVGDDEDERLKSPAFHLFVTSVVTATDLESEQRTLCVTCLKLQSRLVMIYSALIRTAMLQDDPFKDNKGNIRVVSNLGVHGSRLSKVIERI